ncbi:MAG: hypothetical protein WBF71_08455, partial [Microthrixaceae bacterium]
TALAAAVKATGDAPGWVAEISGIVGDARIVFQAPDRIDFRQEMASEPDMQQAVIGTDSWSTDDGGWVKGQTDWRTVAPFTLLDALSSACVVHSDGVFFARVVVGGCAKDQLSDEDTVWHVKVAAGRVDRVEYGTAGTTEAGETTSTGRADDVIDRPELGRMVVTFAYDNVPPVTVPPGG